MVKGAIGNAIRSFGVIAREKPDVVITTGAGAMFFSVLWARLFGAKIVLIESFARFDHLSAFVKLTKPFAHRKVVQAKALGPLLPGAEVFDPLKVLDRPRPPKKPLVFVTVGATLPFDRMVKSVAALRARGELPEEILIQTGIGGYRPEGIQTVDTLDFNEVQALLKDADIVICHGGTGSLITALREGCRTIVMPRLPEHGEHYDNHQADITRSFAARGLVKVANTEAELAEAIKAARDWTPPSATTDPSELRAYLDQLLAEWGRPRPTGSGRAAPAAPRSAGA